MVGSTPVSRPARLIRGWAAVGVSALCAAASHYAVDPNPPNVILQSLAPADPLAMGHDPMVWAHVAAAVLAFVLVRHAEDGWRRLAHAAARVFFTALALVVPALVPCHALRPVPLAYLLPPRAWSPVRIISRRGPPALSV
ncbi:hypothetical protein [Kocuria marina]|uniref:hypothetical protein n=1 Tax=Kocuria marina TaxID=223184 RepID=UPI0021B62EFB|nr:MULTISPECIES: hypothetical protein [Kocuria]MCT2021878.1 hypothetical protein [Kocuria marina]